MGFNILAVSTVVFICSTALAGPDAVVRFELPSDGFASVAINDASGKRVRNFFGSLPLKGGSHEFEWDGRNDEGDLVPPGTYSWIGLRRGDIHALYRGRFQHGEPPWLYGRTGGWISDHSPAVTVVAAGEKMLLGATEAEWGHGVIACDLEGRKLWGQRWLQKRSWCGADVVVTNGTRFFATSYLNESAVWEIDPSTGASSLVFEKSDLAPEHVSSGGRKDYPGIVPPALRVVGARGNELYVTDLFGQEPRTYVLAIGGVNAKLSLKRVLPARPWALAWLSDGRCLAVMDRTVEIFDEESGATNEFVGAGLSQPYAIAVDKFDRVFVSDQGATGAHQYNSEGQLHWRYMRLNGPAVHQVHVFTKTGDKLGSIGTPGGQKVGRFDAQAFYQPAGIAIDSRGRLWVTEYNQSPKRVTVWSVPQDFPKSPVTLDRQFIGPAAYGGAAAMIDPRQPWRLLDTNYGHVLDVDLATGEFSVESLPWRQYDPWKEQGHRPELPFTGRPGVAIRIGDRSFAACSGGYHHGSDARWSPYRFNAGGGVLIGEYVDGRFVPVAGFGNLRMWMRSRELRSRRDSQWMPEAILAAAKSRPDWSDIASRMGMAPDAADVPHVEHKRGSPEWIVHPWPKEISGFIWVDANGDQAMQSDEIEFHPMGDSDNLTIDPQMNLYFEVRDGVDNGDVGTWKVSATGTGLGERLSYSWKSLTRISDAPVSAVQIGKDGSLLALNSLYQADGTLRWRYPMDNRGVKALGPRSRESVIPGRVHRVNAMWGTVDGPESVGTLFMLHNNDGAAYLLSREDGLFIGSLFAPYGFADGIDSIPEAKLGMPLERYSLQDESFNGHFVRAEATGKGFEAGRYYLIGLSRSIVVEIAGLESVERLQGGSLELVAGAGLFGEQKRFDPAATATPAKLNRTVEPIAVPKVKSGKDSFENTQSIKWSGSELRVAWNNTGLLLKWDVRGDKTPFVNSDPDFTQLFSTGDACDVQFESPTLGSIRFVIAMHNDKPAIIRMRYQGDATENAVTYKSGVGEIRLPEVIKLDGQPSVRRIGEDRYVVQVTLPWRTLGVKSPKAGQTFKVEFGIMSSDASGSNTAARDYWASGTSEMVADIPTEAALTAGRGQIDLKD